MDRDQSRNKIKCNRRIIFVIIEIFIIFGIAHSTFPDQENEFNNWIIREFTAPQDLPTDIVRDAIMTYDGSVWLATWGGGIVILDGVHRRAINTGDGLISDYVRVLEEDHSGRVWIGTGEGISCVYNNKIYNFNSDSDPAIPPTNSVNAIECMKNGEVWFGDGQGYLYAWIPSEEQGDPNTGTWKHIYRFMHEPNTCNIQEIQQNGKQEIWLAMDYMGMVRFRSSDDYDVNPWAESSNKLLGIWNGFTFKPNHHLIIGGWKSIYEPQGNREFQTYNFPTDITCLRYAFGKIFIGTESGVFTLKDGQIRYFPLTNDKREFHVESISFLRDQSLWVGTRNGTFRISETNWLQQTHTSPETMFQVKSLARDERGRLFVIDYNNVLWMYSKNRWTALYEFYNSEQPEIDHSQINIQSQKLIVTGSLRYAELDLSTLKIIEDLQHSLIPALYTPLVEGVHQVFLPNENDIWYASLYGLVKIQNNSRIPALDLPQHEKNETYTILQTSPDEYWIGGKGWIDYCSQGNCREVQLPDYIYNPDSKYMTSLHTREGDIWFSQVGLGILRYKEDEWIRENYESGFPGSYIQVLYQSHDGTIWAGDRSKGIISYKDKRWIQYDFDDGFPTGQVNSIVEDENGDIWAGANTELYKLHSDTEPPIAEIVSAPDQLVPDARGVFSFTGYDAWNHTPRNQLVYSWRIIDEKTQEPVQNWSHYSSDTSTLLPPLKPGKYVFEVLTQDKYRNTSLIPARASFAVNPYFWMTYSFQIPVALSFIFASLSMSLLWIRNQQRHELKLQKEKIGFADFCEATHIGVMRLCHNGEIQYSNQAMAEITGFSSSLEMMSHPQPLQWSNQGLYERFISSLVSGDSLHCINLHGIQPKSGNGYYVLLYGTTKDNMLEIIALDFSRQKALEKEIVMTSTKEQQKIGQDLHDIIAQDLTGISYMGQNLLSDWIDRKHFDQNIFEFLVHKINETRTKTRRISKGLAPVHIGKMGLQAALHEIVFFIETLYKIQCEATIDLDITIEIEDADQLYRIAHEAMTNAAKHSSAQIIHLSLIQNERHIILSIKDDGKGFNPAKVRDGIGVEIMKLRASVINAEFNVFSNTPQGTIVECKYSLEKKLRIHPYFPNNITSGTPSTVTAASGDRV